MNAKPSTAFIKELLSLDPSLRGAALSKRVFAKFPMESKNHCDKVRSNFIRAMKKNKVPLLPTRYGLIQPQPAIKAKPRLRSANYSKTCGVSWTPAVARPPLCGSSICSPEENPS